MSDVEAVPMQVRHEHLDCEVRDRLATLRALVQEELYITLSPHSSTTPDHAEAVNDSLHVHCPDNASSASAPVAAETAPVFRAMVFVDDEVMAEHCVGVLQGVIDSINAQMGGGGLSLGAVRCMVESMHIDDRGRSLAAFRDGSCPLLVCSNLAARGLDIPDTTHIFQVSQLS